MISLPPHLLRSFVAVADAGSYTRGGASIFLAQPTVHQHIRQLEVMTGAKLVQQIGKKVRLTTAGRLVYEHGLAISELGQKLTAALADDQSLAAGDLTLAAATTAGEFLLPQICTGFRTAYPGISCGVGIINDPQQVDAAVADGAVDLGFHSKPNDVIGLTKAPILQEQLIGIAPPGHIFGKMTEPVDAMQVAEQPFISFRARAFQAHSSPADFTRLADDWFTTAGANPRVVFSTTSHEGIKNAVRRGLGVAIVASVSVRHDDPSLCTFQLAGAPQRSFVMVYRTTQWRSTACRALMDYALSAAWMEL